MTGLDRRTLFKAGAVTIGGLATPLALQGTLVGAEARPTKGKTLASGLRVPWGLAFLPDGNALVGERISGRIHRVSRKGGRKKVGRIRNVRSNAGEGGLLGLAISPTFQDDHWVYAFYSAPGKNRIVRMRYKGGKLRKTRMILDDIPQGNIHNGGRLAFGPDGMLYATTGDTGNSSLAQNLNSMAGKILRLTPEGGVPGDNPFDSYVWSYGHRNVEGLAFDGNGALWATEFGASDSDELNRIVKGDNYGWPEVEGRRAGGGFHAPFVTWSPTSTCSPSGVAVAKGKAYVGALAGKSLYAVTLRGKKKKRIVRYFRNDFGRIRTVQRAPDGSLWITTSNRDGRGNPGKGDDKVIRINL